MAEFGKCDPLRRLNVYEIAVLQCSLNCPRGMVQFPYPSSFGSLDRPRRAVIKPTTLRTNGRFPVRVYDHLDPLLHQPFGKVCNEQLGPAVLRRRDCNKWCCDECNLQRSNLHPAWRPEEVCSDPSTDGMQPIACRVAGRRQPAMQFQRYPSGETPASKCRIDCRECQAGQTLLAFLITICMVAIVASLSCCTSKKHSATEGTPLGSGSFASRSVHPIQTLSLD